VARWRCAADCVHSVASISDIACLSVSLSHMPRYYSRCTLPTLSSWSSPTPTVFLCICMLMTLKYTDGFSSPSSVDQLQMRMSASIVDIANWMSSNRLQLNANKTVARDLVIYLDSDVGMRSQVTRTVSHCFSILRQLRSIRRSLSHSVSCSCVGADEA